MFFVLRLSVAYEFKVCVFCCMYNVWLNWLSDVVRWLVSLSENWIPRSKVSYYYFGECKQKWRMGKSGQQVKLIGLTYMHFYTCVRRGNCVFVGERDEGIECERNWIEYPDEEGEKGKVYLFLLLFLACTNERHKKTSGRRPIILCGLRRVLSILSGSLLQPATVTFASTHSFGSALSLLPRA